MDSSLKERFGRLARTRVLELVPSGSPVVLVLRPNAEITKVETLSAIKTLVRRGTGPFTAKKAVETCLQAGRAVVQVPIVEDRTVLARELIGAGIAATFLEASDINVREVRHRLGLTQEQFALRYGLDLRSLQNWESGRRKPDAAVRSYLKVIDRLPEPVSRALEDGSSAA